MIEVIGVRFKKAGKIYYFDPDGIEIEKDNHVIVETVRGVEYGAVVVGPKMVSEEDIISPLKKVLRVSTSEDDIKNIENKEKEKEAFDTCVEKIEKHTLDMKLIDVEYTFDNNKVIFYFTADGRVDFRELVKDLASVFRTRIELRQIGVRDEAKMMNGIGPCGIGLCCANWLGEFDPVSIKMAKDQNLSLNPTKISGICGRLMCCLRYEHDTYKKLLKILPRVGEKVMTPDGKAIVKDRNVLLEQIKVKLIIKESKNPDIPNQLDEEFIIYSNDDVKRLNRSGPKSDKQPKKNSEPNDSAKVIDKNNITNETAKVIDKKKASNEPAKVVDKKKASNDSAKVVEKKNASNDPANVVEKKNATETKVDKK